MELPTAGLIPEIDHARQRLAKAAKDVDLRRELVDNVYPLLHMITEMAGQALMAQEERVSNAEIAIAELASVGDSIVLPELAESIDAVLAIGLRLCESVTALVGEEGGPNTTVETADALRALVKSYREGVDELRAEIDDVTVEDLDADAEPDEPAEPKVNGKDKA
jgi:hypothetical protein